ncbi:membrane-associated protein, putative, partial [Bodo saltans]
ISGVSPAAAAIYFCLQPLFVCIFSTIFLGEGISLVQGGGGVLIIAGLLMSAAPNLPGPRQCCNKGSSVEEDDGESEVSKKSDILRIGGQQISGLLRGGAAHENVVMLKPSTYESPRNNEENVELGSAVTATAIMTTSVHDDDPEQPHHLHPDGAVSYASGSLST